MAEGGCYYIDSRRVELSTIVSSCRFLFHSLLRLWPFNPQTSYSFCSIPRFIQVLSLVVIFKHMRYELMPDWAEIDSLAS